MVAITLINGRLINPGGGEQKSVVESLEMGRSPKGEGVVSTAGPSTLHSIFPICADGAKHQARGGPKRREG